ncbi:cell death in tomato 1 [Corynespora cassiicola Philippines]|uniref:Cell death in tomato 1 n=1 Tax=Corynespora cassiicola Philippines TaxID=1448308 RepID=A0A2T2NDX3_CORCC|nr:cell death in tomato 1 [Corynespora cassiicola Philippines]
MKFTASTLAAITALTSSTLAAPLEPRQALEPWQVTGVAVASPAGRPGSYPWGTITANITDPNELTINRNPADGTTITVPAGNKAVNCQAKWLISENPFNRAWPCEPTEDGYWYIYILNGEGIDNFSSSNFDIIFTRVPDVLYQGSRYSGKYEGQANFKVGTNMAGSCGGSGNCFWGLAQGQNPFAVQQHEVTG